MISNSVLFTLISLFTIIIGTIIGPMFAFFMLLQPTEVYFAEIGTEISLYIGESVAIKDHGIKLKFLDVLDDSRCPSDVQCIWEGTVSLMINIQSDSEDLGNFILNSSNLHKASFMGYYVQFKELEPYPISTEIIPKASYYATFIVNEYGSD
ncbi:MAG: hypothetical protein JSV04_09435 [Candidatus Heimdallarchaeota archaeon]|nr:MAG: hypothetical protein JSV04_09435 [Candidatus Heimdallarchaeota archaeon]